MKILLLGLAIFFGVHFVPLVSGVKNSLTDTLGEKPYKGIFSLLALSGLVLIGFGFSGADFTPLWEPPVWARHAALAVMPVALVFLAAADMPGHIRRIVRHPMSIGIVLWSGVHLIANGDLASTLIFGCFGSFAVISAVLALSRGKTKGDGRASIKFDLFAVIGGFVVYTLILYFHEFLIGVPVLS